MRRASSQPSCRENCPSSSPAGNNNARADDNNDKENKDPSRLRTEPDPCSTVAGDFTVLSSMPSPSMPTFRSKKRKSLTMAEVLNKFASTSTPNASSNTTASTSAKSSSAGTVFLSASSAQCIPPVSPLRSSSPTSSNWWLQSESMSPLQLHANDQPAALPRLSPRVQQSSVFFEHSCRPSPCILTELTDDLSDQRATDDSGDNSSSNGCPYAMCRRPVLNIGGHADAVVDFVSTFVPMRLDFMVGDGSSVDYTEQNNSDDEKDEWMARYVNVSLCEGDDNHEERNVDAHKAAGESDTYHENAGIVVGLADDFHNVTSVPEPVDLLTHDSLVSNCRDDDSYYYFHEYIGYVRQSRSRLHHALRLLAETPLGTCPTPLKECWDRILLSVCDTCSSLGAQELASRKVALEAFRTMLVPNELYEELTPVILTQSQRVRFRKIAAADIFHALQLVTPDFAVVLLYVEAFVISRQMFNYVSEE